MSAVNRRGLSLIELLIAASILLLLTTVLGNVLVPVMQRAGYHDQQQEVIQRLILTREFLSRRLNVARFDTVTGVELNYFLPQIMATQVGPLNKIEPTELIAYDTVHKYKLTLSGGQLLEYVPGDGRYDRYLWNMGANATFTIDASAKPLIKFRFQGLRDPRQPTGPSFDHSFGLVLKTYP